MMPKRVLYEKALSTADRAKLEDEDYGIPELRKFPLIDKRHVISANSYFGTAPKKYRKALAKRILVAAKRENIDIDNGKWDDIKRAAKD